LVLIGTFVLSNLVAVRTAKADGLDRVAARMAAAAKTLKRRRIAVLQCPYVDGRSSEGSRLVQERLTTKLAAYHDLEVVERASLGQMIDEITLAQRGLLDSRASYEFGKILDVDAVVTGTLLELPNGKIEINARLIRIPDGLIIGAADGMVRRTWADAASSFRPWNPLQWITALFAAPDGDTQSREDSSRYFLERMDALRTGKDATAIAPASEPSIVGKEGPGLVIR